jgi:hypothetical protein
MKQSLKTIIITTGGVLGISLSVFFLTFVVLAWTGPQHTPPTCPSGEVGCDEVLHTGTAAQSKTGGLLLNTGGATNGLIIESGNVGIGTSSPDVELEVAGQVKITGGTPGAGKVLTSDSVGLASWGAVNGVPSGMIGMFDTACPTGWTRFSALDSKFPQGAETYGGTGGSSTHTHVYSGTTNTLPYYGYGPADGPYDRHNENHSHTYSGTTEATSTLPPYLNVVWCKKD